MTITCINDQGQKLSFGWFLPFWLESAEGLGADFAVSTYQIHGADGSLYSGAQAKERNIVLTLKILRKSGFSSCRDRLYSFFRPRSKGTIMVHDDSINRQAGYYAESVQIEGSGASRTAIVSLICPDPLFYDTAETFTTMADFDNLLEFPFWFEAPFAVAEKSQSLIRSIYNSSAVTVGLQIQFKANGTVRNPQIMDVNLGAALKVNTTLEVGDLLTIDTGAKTIQRDRNGQRTNLINGFDWESEWLQLNPGDNLFRYNADEGLDLVSVTIITRNGYFGA